MSTSPFEISAAENELQLRLYLHHIYAGPSKNQVDVAQPNGPDSFGSIVVNDWPCHDSLGSNAKVIARAQGMHIQAAVNGASSWYNSLNLLFVDDRFKGSTLEVKGTNVTEGEWAIVGGTGEFTKAHGVIYKKKVQDIENGDIIEITINATYTPLEKPTSAKK